MSTKRMVDITPWMGKAKNRIKAIGIELEGGWDSPTAGKAVVRDGSVKFPNQAPPPMPVTVRAPVNPAGPPPPIVVPPVPEGPRYVGEIASPPTAPDDVREWMRKWYPKHINDTCGLHVHMSFSTQRYYHLLMCSQYTDVMFEQLTRWAHEEALPKDHPLWFRLSGKHKTCKHEFKGNIQARAARKIYEGNPGACRYTAINYPIKQHSTVECRLLAMMATWQQGYRGVRRVLDVTNAFLLAVKMREAKQRIHLESPEIVDEQLTVYV